MSVKAWSVIVWVMTPCVFVTGSEDRGDKFLRNAASHPVHQS